MLNTMKARRFLLSGARGEGEPPRPHPCHAGRAPGEGRGNRGDQVSEAAGHLSLSLEARRSAGTSQGRAAPWRLHSRVEARGAGGCGVWMLWDRFLLPSGGGGLGAGGGEAGGGGC